MMKRWVTASALALFCSGCAGSFGTTYSTPGDNVAFLSTSGLAADWRVVGVDVEVPRSLEVSEVNSFAPNADIVWHGDPAGDRYEQVDALMTAAIEAGATKLDGATPVQIAVRVDRFHAMTPRAVARAPGGVHNIAYTARVWSADGQEALTPPIAINADLEAYTGSEAISAINRGETQKVRISQHLTQVTEGWLGVGPDVRREFFAWGR
ncbi:MAG: DUF6778 family protein [Pseudomonadota bacterium]